MGLVDSIITSFYHEHVTQEVYIVGSLKIDSRVENLPSRIGPDLLIEYKLAFGMI
jgi:hypothetical protein